MLVHSQLSSLIYCGLWTDPGLEWNWYVRAPLGKKQIQKFQVGNDSSKLPPKSLHERIKPPPPPPFMKKKMVDDSTSVLWSEYDVM